MIRVEVSMVMVVVGEGGGVMRALGTFGWMLVVPLLVEVVAEERNARSRRRLL